MPRWQALNLMLADQGLLVTVQGMLCTVPLISQKTMQGPGTAPGQGQVQGPPPSEAKEVTHLVGTVVVLCVGIVCTAVGVLLCYARGWLCFQDKTVVVQVPVCMAVPVPEGRPRPDGGFTGWHRAAIPGYEAGGRASQGQEGQQGGHPRPLKGHGAFDSLDSVGEQGQSREKGHAGEEAARPRRLALLTLLPLSFNLSLYSWRLPNFQSLLL